MYLIMNNRGQYLKTTIDKISFVNNKTMADSFNSKRESTDYIIKHFPKRKRKQYHVAFVSDLVEPLSNKESIISQIDLNNNISVDNTISTPKFDYIKKLQDIIDTYLVPEMEKYKSEVKKYDDIKSSSILIKNGLVIIFVMVIQKLMPVGDIKFSKLCKLLNVRGQIAKRNFKE